MQPILDFVRNGSGLTENELEALIRERMQKIPVATQKNWLRQVLLALHAYGRAEQVSAAQRVKDAVARIAPDLGH